MKKICFIVSSPNTAYAFLKSPINRLAKKHEIYIIANFNSHDLEYMKELQIKKTFHFEIVRKISLFKDLKCLFKLIFFLKKNRFDAIHSVSPKAGFIGMVAGNLTFIKMRTHTFTGQVWATKKGLFKYLLKLMDRVIASCATNILVDGKSQLEFLFNNNIAKSKLQLLGNGSISGVSIKRFYPSFSVRKSIREKLKIPQKEWVFMFLGRLNIEKGVVDLINAFSMIDQNKYKCSLYLIGNDEENIKTNYASKNSKIYFIPHQKFPEKLLQACDTFCLPSYREGFGISIIEASALKIPIVCSDIYGLKETVIEGVTGLKHRVGDVEHIKDKLEFVLSNKVLMKKIGENGRKYVEKEFSEKLMLKYWESFYVENLIL
tara:strand:- start:1751 stop:2875 length:1125 start_codon:yes stop_codon:yes gene_type:complete